jgi:hypothetical protein
MNILKKGNKNIKESQPNSEKKSLENENLSLKKEIQPFSQNSANFKIQNKTLLSDKK